MKPKAYREIRKQIGTQGEVAKALGVALNTISRRELGQLEIGREAELAIQYLLARKHQIQTQERKRPAAMRRTPRRT